MRPLFHRLGALLLIPALLATDIRPCASLASPACRQAGAPATALTGSTGQPTDGPTFFASEAFQPFALWMNRSLSKRPIIAFALRVTASVAAGYLVRHLPHPAWSFVSDVGYTLQRAVALSAGHGWADVVLVVLLAGISYISTPIEHPDIARARELYRLGQFKEAIDILTSLRSSGDMTAQLLSQINVELDAALGAMEPEVLECLKIFEPSVSLTEKMIKNEPAAGRLALSQSYYFRANYYLQVGDVRNAFRDSNEGLQALQHISLKENKDPDIKRLRSEYKALLTYSQGKITHLRWSNTFVQNDLQESIRLMTEGISELRSVQPFRADSSEHSAEQAEMLTSLALAMIDSSIYIQDADETTTLIGRIELLTQEAEGLDPNNVRILLLKGKLSELRQDRTSAIAFYEKGYGEAPKHMAASFATLLTLAHFQEGSPSEETLAWSLRIDKPTQIDRHFRAMILYRMNRYPEAIALWEDVLKEIDSSVMGKVGYAPLIYAYLICCYLAVGDAPSGHELLQKYLKAHVPDEIFARYLADGLHSKGLYTYFFKTWLSRQSRDFKLKGLVEAAYDNLATERGHTEQVDPTLVTENDATADERDLVNDEIKSAHQMTLEGKFAGAFGQLKTLVQNNRLRGSTSIENTVNLFLVLWRKDPDLTPHEEKVALLSELHKKVQSLGKQSTPWWSLLEAKVSTALGQVCVKDGEWKEGDMYLARARKELEAFKPSNMPSEPEKKKEVALAFYNAYHWWWFLPRYRWIALGEIKDLRLNLERLQLSRKPLENLFSILPEVEPSMLQQVARCHTELARLEPQQADAHLSRAREAAERLSRTPAAGEYPSMAAGGIALAVHDWESAVKLYRSAFEAGSKSSLVLAGLMRALLHRGKEGDYAEALTIYAQIENLDPFSIFDHGMIYFRQGNYEQAWQSWEPLRRGTYTTGAMKALGELRDYHEYSLQTAILLGHWPEAGMDLQWLLTEKAMDPTETAGVLFRCLKGPEDYGILAEVLGKTALEFRPKVIPLVRTLEGLLRAASRTPEAEALAAYDDYAAEQAKSEWRRSWENTIVPLPSLGKNVLDTFFDATWGLLEAETRATLLADWAGTVVTHKDLGLSGRLFARFLKEFQIACGEEISMTVLESVEKVLAQWGNRGNPAGLTFDQTAMRFKQPDLVKALKDTKAVAQGRRETLTLLPQYESLRTRLSEIASELRQNAYAPEYRGWLDALEQEFLGLRRSRSQPPSTPVDAVENELAGHLETLRKEITWHDDAIAKKEQQDIYDALAVRLVTLEKTLPIRWEEDAFSAEIAALLEDFRQAQSQRSASLAEMVTEYEDKIGTRLAGLRQGIAEREKQERTRQEKAYADLSQRLDVLSVTPANADDIEVSLKRIDDLISDINGFVRDLSGPAAEAFEIRSRELPARAAGLKEKMNDEWRQAGWRRDQKKLGEALNAVSGHEDRQALPALEAQVVPLIERSREWGELYKNEVSRLEAALAAAKVRIIPEPALGGELVRTLINEGIGLPIYDLIRLLYAEPGGQWLLRLAESVHPYINLHRDFAAAEPADLVHALLAGGAFETRQREFVETHLPYIQALDVDGRDTGELTAKLSVLFENIVTLAVQSIQFSFWFSAILEHLADTTQEAEQKTMFAAMGRTSETISKKPAINFLYSAVGAQARLDAETNADLNAVVQNVSATLGEHLGAYDDWNIATGLTLWTKRYRDLFTAIQGRVERAWKATDEQRAAVRQATLAAAQRIALSLAGGLSFAGTRWWWTHHSAPDASPFFVASDILGSHSGPLALVNIVMSLAALFFSPYGAGIRRFARNRLEAA